MYFNTHSLTYYSLILVLSVLSIVYLVSDFVLSCLHLFMLPNLNGTYLNQSLLHYYSHMVNFSKKKKIKNHTCVLAYN